MLDKIVLLVLLSAVPFLELRWSIPIGVFKTVENVPLLGTVQGFGLPVPLVFMVCVLANIAAGMVVYFFVDKILFIFLKVGWIKKIYNKIVVRAQKKSHNLIEKYGVIGLALFIAVPLPGTGAWTGALIGNLLGLGYKKFFIADAIGVTIAGIIVTILTVGVFSLFGAI
ncbi:MAG: small multi-drug export protein [Candidatus Diapherotrites archaeon]|nr:small multi-drug export protein [Candidatus Diapherotrites archaeon]